MHGAWCIACLLTFGHDLWAQLPSHPSSQEHVKYGGPLQTCSRDPRPPRDLGYLGTVPLHLLWSSRRQGASLQTASSPDFRGLSLGSCKRRVGFLRAARVTWSIELTPRATTPRKSPARASRALILRETSLFLARRHSLVYIFCDNGPHGIAVRSPPRARDQRCLPHGRGNHSIVCTWGTPLPGQISWTSASPSGDKPVRLSHLFVPAARS